MKLKLHAAWSQRLKLRAEGDKLWAEAILGTYGNVTLVWSWQTDHGECTLENGDRYDVDQSAEAEAAE